MTRQKKPQAAATAKGEPKSNAQTQEKRQVNHNLFSANIEQITNNEEAALLWLKFGLNPIPIKPNTKKPGLTWQPWLDKLSEKSIKMHWGSNPEHDLGAVIDHSLLVLDADSKESLAALYSLENDHGLHPNLIIKTRKGEHHFFKRAANTYAMTQSYSTDKKPEKIDVKTGRSELDGRSIVVLAPSTNKSIKLITANNIDELIEVDQAFIDAVFKYNDEEPPRLPEPKARIEQSDRAGKHEVAEILSYIDAGLDYSDWLTVLMGVHEHFNGADIGLHIVDAWSATGTNYGGTEEIEYKWRSFTLDGGVKFGSVCYMAQLAGADLAEIKKQFDENGDPRATYEELLALADVMDVNTSPDDIENLVSKMTMLNPIETGKIQNVISKNTGLNLPNIRALAKQHKVAKKKKLYQNIDKPLSSEAMPPTKFIHTSFNDETGALKILSTQNNIEALLDHYGITVAYDTIKKKSVINVPSVNGSPDNADNSALTACLSYAKLNQLETNLVPDYIFAIADKNQRNPVTDWITSVKWDGKDRIQALCDTLRLQAGYPIALRDILVKRWLISAVASALKPMGFHSRGVLTLQGDQSLGKTSWLSSLVPDLALRKNLVKTEYQLDPTCKDSVFGAISYWLVELGELDSTFKKDIGKLKGFITQTIDEMRRPYDRLPVLYQRRTVFFASVNDATFLVDDTGNTRFWTVAVESINYTHGIDMQQLWAQIVEMFQVGEQWWLTKDEEKQIEKINKGHRTVSAIRDLILSSYDFDNLESKTLTLKSATQVLNEIGTKNPTNPQCKEAGKVLREVVGTPKLSGGVNRWAMPLPDIFP
jgi:putative DNA primase/helicase